MRGCGAKETGRCGNRPRRWALVALLFAAPPSALLAAPAAADGKLHFDLTPGSADRQRAYQPGGSGVEPGAQGPAFRFSVTVPEGLYRVTVRLGDRRAPGVTTLKAETRRLMLRSVPTRRGEFVTQSFLVDVRTPALPQPPASAPGVSGVRIDERDRGEPTWDDKLTLEFLGNARPGPVDIEPAAAPTVYLVGDSTVTDQAGEPAASWGQMLPAMLDSTVAVSNHARSGATLKSFLTEMRLDKVLTRLHPGDWLFIQFGHNDQKTAWPLTYVDPEGTYPAYLAAYIAEARRRGAEPVLVTSPERRNFDEQGRIKDTLGAYAAAVRKVAAAEHVPLIDLNADSRAIYEALGPDRAVTMFNDGGADRTHHDNYGAWLLASAVAQRIRAAVPGLAAHVTLPPFSPSHPPAPGDIDLAPSLTSSTQRPAGN